MINKKNIHIFDLVIYFISIVSLVNVFLLTIGYFYPWVSLLISTVILIIWFVFARRRIVLDKENYHWLLIPIILLALFFRLSPNLYLTGGQDQGTYISLSKQYEINHSLYIKDSFRESLPRDLQEKYDEENTLLGIKLLEKDESLYVMPFYPVFPSWLSIFGNLFGSDNRIYALTFFSILSILGMYLFGTELSNRKVGLLGALLLAINPLHLYFSRIPLSEIVSLTFLLFSFYFLIKFYNEYRKKKVDVIYLAISLLLANSLFYTRMSGIFFSPVIIILPLITFLFSKDKKLKKYIFIYSIIWLFSFVLSSFFYKIFLPDLFKLIMRRRFLKIVGEESVILFGALLVCGSVILTKIKKLQIFFRKVFNFGKKYLSIFVFIIFFCLIVYELSFYIKDIIINKNLSLFSNESLSSFKQLSFLVGVLYLSPFGFALFPISLILLRKQITWKIWFLILSLIVLFIYYWGILRTTQYHYYFARYQISELIPLCLLLICIPLVYLWEGKVGKIVSICLISLMSLYFLYFSYIQLQNYEGMEDEPLEKIDEVVGENDLLVVSKENFASFNQIIFPMKYYYSINIFPLIDAGELNDLSIQKELAEYDEIYLLSTSREEDNKRLKFVKEVEFRHNYFVHCLRNEDEFFEKEGNSKDIPFCKYIIIPNRYYYGLYEMYLYKLE